VHQLVIKGFSIVDARCNHEAFSLFPVSESTSHSTYKFPDSVIKYPPPPTQEGVYVWKLYGLIFRLFYNDAACFTERSIRLYCVAHRWVWLSSVQESVRVRLNVVAAVNDFTYTNVSKELAVSIFRVCALHELVVSLKNSTSHYVSACVSIRLSLYLYVFSHPSTSLSFVRPFIHPQMSIHDLYIFYLPVCFTVDISIFISVAILPPVCVSVCTLLIWPAPKVRHLCRYVQRNCTCYFPIKSLCFTPNTAQRPLFSGLFAQVWVT